MSPISLDSLPEGSTLPINTKFTRTQARRRKLSSIVWLSIKIIIPVIVAFKILSLFLYIDFVNGCYIRIVPGYLEFNNSAIIDGLKVLKKADHNNYVKVCNKVGVINPNIGCGGIHGGCYYSNAQSTIYVNSGESSVLLSAMVIAHETCHLYQHLENRAVSEEECYKVGDQIIKKLVVF